MKKIIIMVMTMCLTHVVYGQETKERDILSSEKNLLSEKVEGKLISNEENRISQQGKKRKNLTNSGLIEINLDGIGELHYCELRVNCIKVDDRCIIDGNIILYDRDRIPIDSGTYHIEKDPENGWVLGCGGCDFPRRLGISEEAFLLLRHFVDFPIDCCEDDEECTPIELCPPMIQNELIPLCSDYSITCCDGKLWLEYDIYICGSNIPMSSNKMLFVYEGDGDFSDINLWKMSDGSEIPELIRLLLEEQIIIHGIDLNLCGQGQ